MKALTIQDFTYSIAKNPGQLWVNAFTQLGPMKLIILIKTCTPTKSKVEGCLTIIQRGQKGRGRPRLQHGKQAANTGTEEHAAGDKVGRGWILLSGQQASNCQHFISLEIKSDVSWESSASSHKSYCNLIILLGCTLCSRNWELAPCQSRSEM